MDTNCAPLVADLFLFCYERDFMMSLSEDKQADVIDVWTIFKTLIISLNLYFDNMVSQIYPLELQLNKANTSDKEAAFLFPCFFKKASGILQSPPSIRLSARPSVTLSPKPLDEIQPNLVCELLT